MKRNFRPVRGGMYPPSASTLRNSEPSSRCPAQANCRSRALFPEDDESDETRLKFEMRPNKGWIRHGSEVPEPGPLAPPSDTAVDTLWSCPQSEAKREDRVRHLQRPSPGLNAVTLQF